MAAVNHTLAIALTGGIASGKSTVQKLFEGFGGTVFDADFDLARTCRAGHARIAGNRKRLLVPMYSLHRV